jgi:hypothetical protein
MIIANLGSIPKVRPVSKAIPMVAVRPGNIPMIMPMNVLQNTWNRIMGLNNLNNSLKMNNGPNSILRLSWERNEKETIKYDGDSMALQWQLPVR